jgi:hypothetical protein
MLGRNGLQTGSRLILDPATGTLEVDIKFDLEIQKAILGAARRVALRQQLRLPLVQFRQFTLNLDAAQLKVPRYIQGDLFDFAFNRHHNQTTVRPLPRCRSALRYDLRSAARNYDHSFRTLK